MGKFTAGGTVCVNVTWGSESTELKTSSGVQVVRLRAWKPVGRRERGGKLNWVSNMRGYHNHLQRTSHTQTDKTGQWPWHLRKTYVIWFEIF